MSLIKKSDVHNHLSTRSGATLLPFGLPRPEAPAGPETKPPGKKPDETDISTSPGDPISPEGVPTAQIGSSVGVPGKARKSGTQS